MWHFLHCCSLNIFQLFQILNQSDHHRPIAVVEIVVDDIHRTLFSEADAAELTLVVHGHVLHLVVPVAVEHA